MKQKLINSRHRPFVRPRLKVICLIWILKIILSLWTHFVILEFWEQFTHKLRRFTRTVSVIILNCMCHCGGIVYLFFQYRNTQMFFADNYWIHKLIWRYCPFVLYCIGNAKCFRNYRLSQKSIVGNYASGYYFKSFKTNATQTRKIICSSCCQFNDSSTV